MLESERQLVLAMAQVPGRAHRLAPEAFVASTGIDDPQRWALDELRSALQRHDADDVEYAIMVGAIFGIDNRWVEPLIEVLDADWGHKHEDAAFELGVLADARAVPVLVKAAHWVPDYLDFDEGRALAVKAIHSLGRIPGPQARSALDDLRLHEDRPLRERVDRVIARRDAADARWGTSDGG